MRISDWSSDVCSSDLEVQLVVVVEEPDLAVGGVMQRVGVLGGHLQEVVVAGVDAHAVVDVLGEPRLRLAVALQAHHLEADHQAIADAVAVAGGEVGVDRKSTRLNSSHECAYSMT